MGYLNSFAAFGGHSVQVWAEAKTSFANELLTSVNDLQFSLYNQRKMRRLVRTPGIRSSASHSEVILTVTRFRQVYLSSFVFLVLLDAIPIQWRTSMWDVQLDSVGLSNGIPLCYKVSYPLSQETCHCGERAEPWHA
jgi:hypothetical protein